MAHRIPTLLGYHGNQTRFFDELLGGKLNQNPNAIRPNIWRLFGVGYIIVGDTINLAGWHKVAGPTRTAGGVPAVLYKVDSTPSWAHVIPAAAKVPRRRSSRDLGAVPGRPHLALPGHDVGRHRADRGQHAAGIAGAGQSDRVGARQDVDRARGAGDHAVVALVSENWYPDWMATVDGQPSPNAEGMLFITVPLPVGARQVALEFRSRAYERGRMITFISLIAALGLWLVPMVRRRRADG